MPTDKAITDTAAFLFAKLGELSTARFADRLAPLGLRPRLCGVLGLLLRSPAAQTDLARTLRVTPSVVVDMLDELETLRAVRRVRDPADRRRQVAELTARGRRLAARSASLARELDSELLADIDPAERTALVGTLRRLGTVHGILAE